MPKISLDKIIWGERSRKDYKDVNALAESIKEFGLFHPIVLDDKYNLIAGGRRLSALVLLGWQEIPYTSMGDLSPLRLREVELEENIQREDLDWDERCGLTQEINNLQKEIHGDKWKVIDTAGILDQSRTKTFDDINMAEGLQEFPELRTEKKEKHARTKLRRLRDAKRRKAIITPKQTLRLYHGKAEDYLSKIDPNSIDLALLDPPYNMNVGDQRWARESWNINFDDNDKDENLSLYNKLIEEMARVLKDDGHCYVFFSMTLYPQIINIIRKHLSFNPVPLIWQKGAMGGNPDPYHRYAYNYEPMIFCWKGKTCREFSKPSPAVFQYGIVQGEKRGHPTEKPIDLYKHLIEMATSEGDLVIDPTMGSGMALKAAKELKRNIIGIEMNEDWYNLACENIGEADE